MALDFLLEEDGKTTAFGPGEVQELLDHVVDAMEDRPLQLEQRWCMEDAIADAFGMKLDEDRDLVRKEAS